MIHEWTLFAISPLLLLVPNCDTYCVKLCCNLVEVDIYIVLAAICSSRGDTES